MSVLSCAGIAERVKSLIKSKDRGDSERASRRLGVPAGDLERAEQILTEHLCEDRDQDSALRLLAAVTRAYQADPYWLLTGFSDTRRANLSELDRLRVADLLLRLGDFLIRERPAHRLMRQQPWTLAV